MAEGPFGLIDAAHDGAFDAGVGKGLQFGGVEFMWGLALQPVLHGSFEPAFDHAEALKTHLFGFVFWVMKGEVGQGRLNEAGVHELAGRGKQVHAEGAPADRFAGAGDEQSAGVKDGAFEIFIAFFRPEKDEFGEKGSGFVIESEARHGLVSTLADETMPPGNFGGLGFGDGFVFFELAAVVGHEA